MPTEDLTAGPATHSLDHFAIAVPDLDEAAAYYRAFGLDVTRNGDALEVRTFEHPHIWMRIAGAPRRRARYPRLFHEMVY